MAEKKTSTKKKKSTKSAVTSAKKSPQSAPAKTVKERVVKPPEYKWYYIGRRVKPPLQSIPGALRIFFRSLKIIRQNWSLFLGITAIYGAAALILVRGFSNIDLEGLKNSYIVTNPTFTAFSASFNTFLYLLQYGNSSTSPTAGVYQGLSFFIFSLILIWVLRELYAERLVSIKDAFYNSTTPLIRSLMVLVVIAVQLLPAIVGIYIFTAIVRNGVAVVWWQKTIFTIISAILTFWSLRMITASLFAFIIVTLPDMTPMKAIRAAKDLVHYRRVRVFSKLLFLPIIMAIITSVLVIPFILWLPVVASWIYFSLTIIWFVIGLSYLYNLYRSLI